MATQPDSRQVKKRQALKNLGTPALASVETILDKVNTEVDSPLRLSASAVPDALLNFASSLLTAADTGRKVVSPVKKQIFSTLTNPTINFQTQALSNAADFDIVFPASTVGFYRNVGFTLIGSGKIKAIFSAETATEGALTNPGALFVSGGLPIGYVTLQCTNVLGYFKTAGSATSIIENTKIFRLAAGGGGGSSSDGSGSGGGELVDLLYSAAIRDSFANIPDGTTTVDVTAGKTDATLHDVANELFVLSYDANKTVTGTGTAMTLSLAPAFTIKAGDMLIVASEARRISAITSQTVITIESAFTVDPSAATCCVSQAVHTVDLNAFTAGGLGLAASSQYTGNIDDIMVGYQDSSTSSDIIPDFGVAPVIAFSASSDATTWSGVKFRVTSLSTQEEAITCPTTSNQLALRFFANKTTGTGTVNLLGYKVFFHKMLGSAIGSGLLSAFARPTSSIAQNCVHSVAGGKSRFTFTWAYPSGLNSGEASGSALEVYINGQRIPRYAAGVTDLAQAYFTEDSSSVITLDTDYSAVGLDFQFIVKNQVIDSNTTNTSKIAIHDDLLDQTIEAQVVPTWLTAVSGTPNSSQFRSDITNRSRIPDLSNMLAVQMGPQRMVTQDIFRIQDEVGPSGQPVFGAVNDKFNQIRFVGNWTSSISATGMQISTSSNTDYFEIIIYGTGLNILQALANGAGDFRYSVDGAVEVAYTFTAPSNILTSRGYSANQILPIISGLSLGLHTIKVRLNSGGVQNFNIYGFEVLTDTTSLRVTPGTIVKGKYKNILSSLQTVAYDSSFESGTLGTRGGCVLVYLKTDGTIGKAVTPTDATALYLANTNHTNEEPIRRFYFREFGAGRTDDFSSLTTTNSNRAFTLDDGTTTLTGFNVYAPTELLSLFDNTSYLTITFVGTGLDVVSNSTASGALGNVIVDGTSIGTYARAGAGNIVKICSGLPYGTHSVRFTMTAGGAAIFNELIIYAPKKPTITSDNIELAQYYNVANYDGSTITGTVVADNAQMPVGTIFKTPMREGVYVGANWVLSAANGDYPGGFHAGTQTTNSQPVTYTFFGTGFVVLHAASGIGTYDFSVAVDSVLNATGVARSNASNLGGGSYRSTSVVGASPCRVEFTGLTLGLHTVTIQRTAGAGNHAFVGLDIITPIHAPANNGPFVVQNTLMVGNNNFIDLRKFNERDVLISSYNNISQAKGIASAPTTSSTTGVPMPDMSVTHLSKTGRVRISATASLRSNTLGASSYIVLYVNGIAINSVKVIDQPVVNYTMNYNDSIVVNVPIGTSKIDVYWFTGATTLTASALSRNLTVEDV